jgi:3-oxoacid CoA-transferase subunit A
VAEQKEIRSFNGKEYLLEYAFQADYALVKAWKGDTDGNLIYKETARNFNPLMAMGGKITIAEVEQLVPQESWIPILFIHRGYMFTNLPGQKL